MTVQWKLQWINAKFFLEQISNKTKEAETISQQVTFVQILKTIYS